MFWVSGGRMGRPMLLSIAKHALRLYLQALADFT